MEYPLYIKNSVLFEDYLLHMAAPGNSSAIDAEVVREEAFKDFELATRGSKPQIVDTSWVYANERHIKSKREDKVWEKDEDEDEDEIENLCESWEHAAKIVFENKIDHFIWSGRKIEPII